jgi:hypothetical protein
MRLATCTAALALLVSAPAFAQAPAAGVPDPNAAAVPPPPPPVDPGAPVVVPPPPAPVVVETAPVAAPMAPAAAAPAAPAWYSMIKTELLADSYYMWNFSQDNSLAGAAGRNFDVATNSFSLNYAKVGLQVDVDPISVRVDLGYGHTGAIINGGSGLVSGPPAGEGGSVSGPAGVLYGNAFIIQQAFASLKVPGTALTIDFGKFVTTAGAEVIEANKNWLYSRSMLFYVIPLLHTGARVNFKVNDMVTLQGSLVNGINNDPDNNSAKTGGFSVAIAPVSTTNIIATTYFGKEGPQGASGPTKFTGDLVVGHNISDAFGLNLNFDYVKVGDANLWGAALMGRYVAAEHFVLAARGEFLADKGIYWGGAVPEDALNMYEGTLMAGFPFAGGKYEARVELRGDFAADPVFNGKDNQMTGTLAVLGSL